MGLDCVAQYHDERESCNRTRELPCNQVPKGWDHWRNICECKDPAPNGNPPPTAAPPTVSPPSANPTPPTIKIPTPAPTIPPQMPPVAIPTSAPATASPSPKSVNVEKSSSSSSTLVIIIASAAGGGLIILIAVYLACRTRRKDIEKDKEEKDKAGEQAADPAIATDIVVPPEP